jgi:ferredoxin
MAGENDNVQAHIRYSQPAPDDLEGSDYDSAGHIDIDLLKRLLPFDDYEFYLCGPTPFMRSLYCGLLSMGVAEARVHYEFFGPASELKEDASPHAQKLASHPDNELGGRHEVRFARSGVSTTWDPQCESLLDLAEREGLNPPYSCRSGICRTCMCELVEGEVEYLEEPLTAPDAGHVLICVSKPRSKVVVDL